MARGAAAAPAGSGTATAPATPSAGDDKPASIPEKYQVKNEDGTINWEASALKQAQGYDSLAKRMGAGEAPPQTPDGYAPELPQGLTMDQLKTDPMFAGFLKGAHAKGMNNAQVSWAISEYASRVNMMNEQRNDPGVAEAELGKVWTTPQMMERGLNDSFRAAQAFAVDQEHAARLDKKFGNDPDFIQLMAKVGKELGEDTPPQGITGTERESREALMKSPAYLDAKHPDHAVTVAKVRASYEKEFAGR